MKFNKPTNSKDFALDTCLCLASLENVFTFIKMSACEGILSKEQAQDVAIILQDLGKSYKTIQALLEKVIKEEDLSAEEITSLAKQRMKIQSEKE